MNFLIAMMLGALFALITCYVQKVSVIDYRNLLLVLVYSVTSWPLLLSVDIKTVVDVLIGVSSFLLIGCVFWLILQLSKLSGQNLTINWPMAIFFWIIVSGLIMENLITKRV